MKSVVLSSVLILFSHVATAQSLDPMARAVQAGHCAQTGVKSAEVLSSGALQITCFRKSIFRKTPDPLTPAPDGAEVTNFAPLLGALGPAAIGIGAAGAGILALAGGNSSTSDTQ